MVPTSTCGYMNTQEHTWAALGCRSNSTCKLFNPEYWHQALASWHSLSCKTDHVGVTTMERLDHWSSQSETRGPENDISQQGIKTGPPWWKARTLAKNCSSIILIAIRNIWACNKYFKCFIICFCRVCWIIGVLVYQLLPLLHVFSRHVGRSVLNCSYKSL